MLASMLGSMLVSSFQGMGGPWERYHGGPWWLPCCFLAFRVWDGKGSMGVHAGFHVGFHVGFQLPGYWGGHHGKGTVGVHVDFHARYVLCSWQLLFLKKSAQRVVLDIIFVFF